MCSSGVVKQNRLYFEPDNMLVGGQQPSRTSDGRKFDGHVKWLGTMLWKTRPSLIAWK